MNVLIAGNLANMGYEIAKAMRKKDIDVKLLLPKFPVKSDDPRFMYPEMEKSGYPEWLVRYDNYNRSFGLNNWKFQVIREMRKSNSDVIIAMTEFSIFAMFSGKPYAALSTGSDMRILAFEKSLKGFLYRLSYRKAKIIIWGEPDKYILLKKLGILDKAVFANAPRNVNFHPEKLDKGNLKGKFVIFHPVTQDWKIKRNDIFLHAFNELCKIRDDVFLILSNRGPDIERAKKILEGNQTKGKYQLIPLIDAEKLQYYYNLSDIVVDQFGIGSLGMIAVEAMKCGKPVLMKIDEEMYTRYYGQTPQGIMSADNEKTVFEFLNKLAHNHFLVNELGLKNKEWIDDKWNTDLLAQKYIDICRKLLNSKKIGI